MRILIADDDPVMLDTLRLCVATEGFDALLAADGEEAFMLWDRHRPDLLCLDIMMPKLDGYEVCRRVRAIDPTVPILFLSAKSEEIDVVVGFQLGADDFVRKPFGKHELIARIRAVLRRARSVPGRSGSFSMNDLTVWPAELRAERGGHSIDLSPAKPASSSSSTSAPVRWSTAIPSSINAGGSTISPSPARSTSTSPSCASASRPTPTIR